MAAASPNPQAQDYIDSAIDAAAECFRTNGVRQTNMADVARTANMARSTLYKYFKDRNALVVSVIERETLRIAAEILPAMSDGHSIDELVVESLLLAQDKIEANPTLYTILSMDTSSNQLLLASDRMSELLVELVSPVFDTLRAEGSLRADIETEQVIDIVMRLLISFLTIPSKAASSKDKKRAMLRSLLLPALRPE